MNFEFERSMSPGTSFQQRIVNFFLILLSILILITLISGIGMKLLSNHFESSFESNNQQPQEHEMLLLQRNHLQEQLLSYELQPESEVIFILNDFLQNLSLLLPAGAQLSELRCEENGKLLLAGQVNDLVSFQTMTEENTNSFWSYESSNLTRIESTLYEFQLAYSICYGDSEP